MDFGLSETQRLLQESVMRFGQKQCAPEILKDHDKDHLQHLQKEFNALGLMGVLTPESTGGQDGTLLDVVCIQEALGFSAAPISFIANGVLAPIALKEAAHPDQQAAYFPKLADGTARFGAALDALENASRDSGITARGTTTQGDCLNGKTFLALETKNATHILTAAQDGALFIVPADQILFQETSTIDETRNFSTIILNQAKAVRLDGENQVGQTAARLLAAGRIVLAADMLGAAQAMLERAVAYSKERQQFGRVIGSFQAVKHLCAEMAARLEPCRAMLWYAAHCFDETPAEALWMAALTKAHISEAARFCARSAIEVYGGMGFTQESHMHVWFKRIGVNYQALGAPEHLRDRAAAFQFN